MLRSIFKRLPLVSAAALALGVATTGIALTQHARASTTIITSCHNRSTCLKWSNTGTGTAFSGTAISTYAFLGSSQSATGAYFSSKDTTHGYDGVLGTVNGGLAGVGGYGYNGSTGTEGVSDSGDGVHASSGTGIGLNAVSTSGVGAFAITNTDSNYALEAGNTASNGPPFLAYNSADGGYFGVDHLGDGEFSGYVFTIGSCNIGCDRTHGIGEYAKRSSLPTIEDEGEVALRNGSAYVAFDSSFRNVIDAHRSYLVTVTPEGDSKGMFVSGKTSAGFFIRENQGGRSNVLVTYKVDARTLGEDRGRLPAMSAPAAVSSPPRRSRP
jgi:hypothetical protein